MFAENGGHGLLFVQGRYALQCDLLRLAAGNLTFWLDPPSLDIAMVRNYGRDNQWPYTDSPFPISA
jgi:hypothetical protein